MFPPKTSFPSFSVHIDPQTTYFIYIVPQCSWFVAMLRITSETTRFHSSILIIASIIAQKRARLPPVFLLISQSKHSELTFFRKRRIFLLMIFEKISPECSLHPTLFIRTKRSSPALLDSKIQISLLFMIDRLFILIYHLKTTFLIIQSVFLSLPFVRSSHEAYLLPRQRLLPPYLKMEKDKTQTEARKDNNVEGE